MKFQLISKPIRWGALLMKYEINLDKLHETIKPKVEAFINKAAEEGRITQQEKEFIFNHLRMR